jgi:hypothetical protein
MAEVEKRESPKPTTPGKPEDSGSRQQTHKHQSTQTGSPDLDRDASRRSDVPPVPVVPPNAK